MSSTKVSPIATMPVMAAASIRSVRPCDDRKRWFDERGADEHDEQRDGDRHLAAPQDGARRSCAARSPAAARSALGDAHAAAAWPVAASMIRSCVASAREQLAHQPALAHDEHAVGHAEHLGQLAARSSGSARPCAASSLEQAVHLGLGADVDAARRLVDHEQLRVRWPATWPSTTFCWLPPDSRSTGCSRPACLSCRRRRPALGQRLLVRASGSGRAGAAGRAP